MFKLFFIIMVTNLYTIKYVCKRTGLTSHAIRAWEKRYKAVVPQRSPKNRRLYSEADVQRLQLLKKMTDVGHSISQVARLEFNELMDLAQREASVIDQTRHSKTRPSHSTTTHDHNDYYQYCLSAVLNLDPERLERTFDQAAVDLTRIALLRELIVPLFKEIGKLWHGGSLKIVNEHMATTVTRNFLLNLLRTTDISDSAEKIVVATTVGQWHDVGALTVALTAAENGWHPVYYGPNLPAEEIATAVKQSDARAVAISITHLLNQNALINELRKLARYIGQDVALFIGGRAVGDHPQVLEEIQAKYINDIDQFREELNSLLIVNVG
jgi:DNA-binding transcriptional MerR regulator/methylmalonyl-CoA mutase cobalamin-binding subunit